MRVIITGGSGLIGRALAGSLADDRHEVIVLSRFPERLAGLPEGVSAQRWDGRSSNGWGELVDKAEAVVNLAGENIASGRWTKARKRRIMESRLGAGRAVVEAVEAASHRPRVLIQASGVGYYGRTGDSRVTEDAPSGDDFLSSVAIQWEASTRGVERLGVRHVAIRTGVVLSAHGGALRRMMLPFMFFVGGPIGKGSQWLPWIHISDEVRAIRFLIERGTATGPYNLSAPAPVTNRQFSRTLGKQLKRPSITLLPGVVLRVVFGEMSTVLLDGQKAMPQRLLSAGFDFRFSELGPALSDLLT